MKPDQESETPTAQPDVELEQGCLLCGGPLSLRVVGSSAATYCRTCHWISRPHLHRHGDGVHLFHPSRMVA